ncbi:MAG: PmoA family protein, partial [Planctomycetaceae bacterium]
MSQPIPRCRILPLPGHQAAFEIDGVERLRWHFGSESPRPFFYPLLGPGGTSLTRMGHPGAPNHDHHQSIWFAHHKVLGIDFWGYQAQARIRQQQWLAYEDGEDECIMAVRLGWSDGHDPRPLLMQDLVAAVRPGEDDETFLELQATFTPTAEALEFGKTNFGFLAVRVAANISEHFGGGRLTDSEGRTGEPAIFGHAAKWMDYSGPVPGGGMEGVTYFDHPSNPRHPTRWHVREDGWMGASVCMSEPLITTQSDPLVLRYLLHAHRDGAEAARAERVFADFAARPGFDVGQA